MNKFIVKLEDELFPVTAFFSAISHSRWPRVLENFSRGIGVTINDMSCELPGEEEAGEPPLNGVGFFFFEEEAVLEVERFLVIVRQVCDEYLNTNDGEKELVERLYAQLYANTRKWDVK